MITVAMDFHLRLELLSVAGKLLGVIDIALFY